MKDIQMSLSIIKFLVYHTKKSGRHVIQSYQEEVNSDGFNNMIGLTAYETKLALKKMKRLGLFTSSVSN